MGLVRGNTNLSPLYAIWLVGKNAALFILGSSDNPSSQPYLCAGHVRGR